VIPAQPRPRIKHGVVRRTVQDVPEQLALGSPARPCCEAGPSRSKNQRRKIKDRGENQPCERVGRVQAPCLGRNELAHRPELRPVLANASIRGGAPKRVLRCLRSAFPDGRTTSATAARNAAGIRTPRAGSGPRSPRSLRGAFQVRNGSRRTEWSPPFPRRGQIRLRTTTGRPWSPARETIC